MEFLKLLEDMGSSEGSSGPMLEPWWLFWGPLQGHSGVFRECLLSFFSGAASDILGDS